ncbi:LPXTG cell wall anchor domain-containing protein [Streptococcus suis]|uniref:LPXTG cell wall anchor domain-containing protein n=1 Tax=Streptococcus suis TaxID=1307 RepID=UPI0037077877
MVSLAALALIGSTVSANEIGVATAHGTGVTAPALNENGLYFKNIPTEALTAERLSEVQIGGKDGGLYLYAKGKGATVEFPTTDPATLVATPAVAPKVEVPKAEVAAPKAASSKATGVSSAKLPETGEASTAVYFATALGLLGAAAMLVKKQEN